MNTKIRKQRKINRAEFIENYVKLYDSNNNSFLVSTEDYEKIKWRMWRVDTKTGYVSTRIGGKSVRLHRYIMNPPENKTVDHINHDKTDNRRENLRICSMRENNLNKKRKGVRFDRRRNLWQAYVYSEKGFKHLGYFRSEEEAVKVRKKNEKIYYGEFRYAES